MAWLESTMQSFAKLGLQINGIGCSVYATNGIFPYTKLKITSFSPGSGSGSSTKPRYLVYYIDGTDSGSCYPALNEEVDLSQYFTKSVLKVYVDNNYLGRESVTECEFYN